MARLFSRDLRISQKFEIDASSNRVRQELSIGEKVFSTALELRRRSSRKPDAAWVQAFLAGRTHMGPPLNRSVRLVDLFCAAGGLSAGFKSAAASVGIRTDVAMAVDADSDALELYRENHGPMLSAGADVQSLVNYHVAGRGSDATWSTWPSLIEPHMASFLADVDVLVAGPPCQGHSNLNNHTRRSDQRNLLYITTVAFAVAVGAKVCIIENVPEVLNDAHEVLPTSRALLIKSGYQIDDAVLSADSFGVPQRRRRHFLVAVRNSQCEFDLKNLLAGLHVAPVSVRQAIGDLANLKSDNLFDSVGTLSPDNVRRINWLFDNDEYDLSDAERPECHRNGHTYRSIYGRMRWDEPAQTLTTGFLTPGRGRFVHPGNRRTITPHEAARLQSFPDSFTFVPHNRKSTKSILQKVIGDAVPPLLARAVSLGALALLDSVNDGQFIST